MNKSEHINNLILEERSKGNISTKDISDGFHTFGELYDHRAKLFSIICNNNCDKAWKSKLHYDGTMFDGDMFIVGIETDRGQYSYHYHVDEYWSLFDVKVLDRAPEWDGHKPEDIDRLFNLKEKKEMSAPPPPPMPIKADVYDEKIGLKKRKKK